MPGYGLALTLVGGLLKYTASVINRLHAIVNTQLYASAESLGTGVKARKYGDTSFQVTAGTGLNIAIGPGSGNIIGTTLPSAAIERSTSITLAVPASSTCYVYNGLENNPPYNRTEETGLPLSFISTNATEPNAVRLATVTTSGSAVTAVVNDWGATGPNIFIDRVDPEQVRDAIGVALTDSATVTKTVDDATDTITLSVPNNAITDAKLRDSAGLSVIGRSANTTGDPADIVAATDGHVLRRSGTAVGFGTIGAALNTFAALGDTLYGGTAGAGTLLSGNTTATRKFLRQTGTGSASAAPAWDVLTAADVPLGAGISGYDTTNGQAFGTYQVSELVTIAAAASTTTAGTIPAGCVVKAVSVRVTVAIPTATAFDIGVSGATTRYGAALSTAAGTTNASGGSVNPSCYSAATGLVLTPNATPASNTGRVRVTWYYELATPPTS